MPLSARVRALPATCLAAAVALPMAFAGPLPASAQKPVQSKPAAPLSAAERATALLRAGRPVEALAILRPAVEARRNDLTLLFLVGRAGIAAASRQGLDDASRTAFLDAAIAALRRMLTIRPGLTRARLELARAFFLKGEDGLARRHFERVLAGNPPAAVALNVNRFLNIMRARKRWTVRVGMALAPDSNISSRSDERTILIDTPFGRLPFTTQGDKPKSGVGIAAWAGGEYQYPIDPRWRLRAGGDVSRREYRAREFDRTFVSAHLGPRRLIGRASEASVLASVRQSWLADEEDFRDLGVRIEGHHRLNRRTVAFLNAARHERRYEGRDWLDGPLTDLSAGASWAASPTMRVNAALGWSRQRTELERQRNESRWGRVGATFLLPWGFTVGGAATLRWTDYEGEWVPFVVGGGERRDLTRALRLDLHNRAVTVGGFSPQLSMTQEERTSNAQLYGYDRLSGELRFVRLF
ncbi:MAG: surface lipoprotein assembly modifier [Defluviicoccus sp.]|nr:surface lipoprotein assembly modifier [Defluviicoccus sp.]